MPDPSTVDGLTQSGTIIAWERQFGWRQRRVAKVFHSRGQRNLTTCQGSNQCWLRTRRLSPVLLQLPAILYSISLPLTLPLLSLSVSRVRCLRAFCSWLVVCALLCHCICVSLGYAKSITRHNRISYGGTPPPPHPFAVSVSVSFSVPFPFSLSIPFPFLVSVVLEFFNLICSTDFRSFKTCFCYCFFFSLNVWECVSVSVFVFVLLRCCCCSYCCPWALRLSSPIYRIFTLILR